MQGVLLESAGLDGYLSLGKSGYPVFQSAQQILAALGQHPELLPFFAIPQRNEKGSQIDWYSPVPGSVIAWRNASEEEREDARVQLEKFTAQLLALGRESVERGRQGRPDALRFGELLQEACKVPSADNIFLVMPARSQAARTGQTAVSQAEGAAVEAAPPIPPTSLQPVLTFWGFVGNDEDRHRAPLYFLTPRPLPPVLSAPLSAATTAAVQPVVEKETVVVPPVNTVTAVNAVAAPWWKRWWFWLALLLAVLLLGWLLRACMPAVVLPTLPSGGLPTVQLPQGTSGVTVPVPTGSLPQDPLQGGITPEASLGALPGANVLAEMPQLAGQAPGQGVMPDATLQAPAVSGLSTPALQVPQTAEGVPAQAAQAPVVPSPSVQPPQLEIPPQVAEGPAQFLDGKYNTRGGLVDDKTNEPLQLQYAFKNGKGQVEVKRSNGVICKGDVLAAMQKGTLGISSQGNASCDDGSSYTLPKIICKPGASTAADCTGEYGTNHFPIQMQRKSV